MDAIKGVQPPGKWKIVVVDSKSIEILNASCKMYDILEENVSLSIKTKQATHLFFFSSNSFTVSLDFLYR